MNFYVLDACALLALLHDEDRHRGQYYSILRLKQSLESTQRCLDHESFAVKCLPALLRCASYPVLVHRLTGSFHASFPRLVTLTRLHFLSFAVVGLREDFHRQRLKPLAAPSLFAKVVACPVAFRKKKLKNAKNIFTTRKNFFTVAQRVVASPAFLCGKQRAC
jgi:hypothetical protein